MAENKACYVKERVFHFFAQDSMEPLSFSRWQNLLVGKEAFGLYRSCSARIAHAYVEYDGDHAIYCHEIIGGIYDFDVEGIIDKKRLLSLDNFTKHNDLVLDEEFDMPGKVIDARDIFLERRRSTVSWSPTDQQVSLILAYLDLL